MIHIIADAENNKVRLYIQGDQGTVALETAKILEGIFNNRQYLDLFIDLFNLKCEDFKKELNKNDQNNSSN